MASGISSASLSSISLKELISSLSPDRLNEIENMCREEEKQAKNKTELGHFFCPISQSFMQDPVILDCLHCFERAEIEKWREYSLS